MNVKKLYFGRKLFKYNFINARTWSWVSCKSDEFCWGRVHHINMWFVVSLSFR